jgi:hypothetical protein
VTELVAVIPVQAEGAILESSCEVQRLTKSWMPVSGHWHDGRESVIAVQAEGAILDGPTIRSRYEALFEDTVLDESVTR